MLIGVDFDNTIVSYDAVFHRVALERRLIPADLPVNKTAVRDHLRAAGNEDAWTEMQGEVYGARMAEAEPFPGVLEFFRACRERGVRVVIVSHKTKRPFLGPPHDLHAAARGWLKQHGFFDEKRAGLQLGDVFFELTKAEKLSRIAACEVTHFIDDLPEILGDAAFPHGVRRYLFDPQQTAVKAAEIETMQCWRAVASALLAPDCADVLRRLHFTPTGTPQAVQGGANNRVYRQRLTDGRAVLVKHYAPRGPDGRDRFATERAFYRYIMAARVSSTTSALGWDNTARVGVFAWNEGFAPETIETRHVDAALRFLSELNHGRAKPEAVALAPASEARFSLAAHLAAVNARVNALLSLPGDEPIVEQARDFVQGTVVPAWNELAARVQAQVGAAAMEHELATEERCISPSDFGFHNSLERADGRIVFFDFEYAGWDDPAKLVADFFCQPDRPVPLARFDSFTAQFAAALPVAARSDFLQRCGWLLPVYRVKWVCILLNEFTAMGRARRDFSLGTRLAAERRTRQLARAHAMLAPLQLAAA